MYDDEGNILGTKTVEPTTGNSQVEVIGEVYIIEFESDDVDSWHVNVGLTENGITINTLFTCIDCHANSNTIALDGVSVGVDEEGTTMDDGSHSAGCDTKCRFVRDIHPCASFPCDPNARCEDNGGTAECTCNETHTGDGFTCTGLFNIFLFENTPTKI